MYKLSDGAKSPIRLPLKGPYELIHVARKAGALKIYFEQPPTSLAMPANYIADILYKWSQKVNLNNNPWRSINTTYRNFGGVAYTIINTGTIVMHRQSDYVVTAAIYNAQLVSLYNWSHNKVNNKYSYEFYLDNDLEETTPTVLYDDDETLWSAVGAGSAVAEETTIKVKGTSSVKIDVLSGVANSGGLYTLAGDTDISAKEFLPVYLYGANGGDTVRVSVTNNAADVGRYYDIVENFTGWKRFVIPLNVMTNIGAGTLTAIRKASVIYTAPSANRTLYADRILADVGRWVKVEAYVPDAPLTWNLYAYNQGTPAYRATPFLTEAGYAEAQLQFLDQTLQSQILAATKGGAYYAQGGRGETKAAGGDTDAGDIIYSALYGCLKRIGFAIKMPPDDGWDSATAGISQCRLKLEVTYADSLDPAGVQGQATYEFQPDNADANYGLDNLTANWLALFDSKKVYYLIYDKELDGLKVCADENEYIHWLEMTLEAGTRVFMGEIHWGNIAADLDGDGVPDFLEGPGEEGCVLDLPCDEIVGGKVLDISGYANHGTLDGPTLVAGKIGNALGYDGINDYVSVTHSSSISPSSIASFGFWLYVRAYPAPSTVIVEALRKFEGWAMASYRGDFVSPTWQLGITETSLLARVLCPTSADIPPNTWVHVFVTANGTQVRLFLNGGLYAAPVSYDGTLRGGTGNLFVGSHRITERFINAIIDEVRVYNRALTAAEVMKIYQEGRAKYGSVPALVKGVPKLWT